MGTDEMVVDDEDAVRRSGSDYARAALCAAIETTNGPKLAGPLSSQGVVTLFLDVTLCRDGHGAAVRVENPPPLVVATARTLEPADLLPVEGRIGAVLTNPVAPDTLLEQVRLVLQGGCT